MASITYVSIMGGGCELEIVSEKIDCVFPVSLEDCFSSSRSIIGERNVALLHRRVSTRQAWLGFELCWVGSGCDLDLLLLY